MPFELLNLLLSLFLVAALSGLISRCPGESFLVRFHE